LGGKKAVSSAKQQHGDQSIGKNFIIMKTFTELVATEKGRTRERRSTEAIKGHSPNIDVKGAERERFRWYGNMFFRIGVKRRTMDSASGLSHRISGSKKGGKKKVKKREKKMDEQSCKN